MEFSPEQRRFDAVREDLVLVGRCAAWPCPAKLPRSPGRRPPCRAGGRHRHVRCLAHVGIGPPREIEGQSTGLLRRTSAQDGNCRPRASGRGRSGPGASAARNGPTADGRARPAGAGPPPQRRGRDGELAADTCWAPRGQARAVSAIIFLCPRAPTYFGWNSITTFGLTSALWRLPANCPPMS
jgi:hypothetical protein